MSNTSFTNDQMRQLEGRLAKHEDIIELARQKAVEQSDDPMQDPRLLLDDSQDPSVELEQSGQYGLELCWSGYFKSQDASKPRVWAMIVIDDETLRELVGEDFFLFEDQDSEPDENYSEE